MKYIDEKLKKAIEMLKKYPEIKKQKEAFEKLVVMNFDIFEEIEEIQEKKSSELEKIFRENFVNSELMKAQGARYINNRYILQIIEMALESIEEEDGGDYYAIIQASIFERKTGYDLEDRLIELNHPLGESTIRRKKKEAVKLISSYLFESCAVNFKNVVNSVKNIELFTSYERVAVGATA